MKLTGACLCGGVTYTSDSPPVMAGHCYCRDCRRASGTAHCTHVMVAADGFSASGEVTFYASAADSGNMVRRGFCPACGSQMWSTNAAMPGHVFLRASSLDDPDQIMPQMSVYVSRAPTWDAPPAELPAFAEMPPQGPATLEA